MDLEFVADDAGPRNCMRQAAGGFVFMDIARLHPYDMELFDPRSGYHRPIIPGQNPPLEEQDAVMVIGYQERLGKHGAIDSVGGQSRAP